LEQGLTEIERMLCVGAIRGLRSLEACDRVGQHACLLRRDARRRLKTGVRGLQQCGAQIRLRCRCAFRRLQRWLNGRDRPGKMRSAENLLHIRVVRQRIGKSHGNPQRIIESCRAK
jgi:hypothetical protein